MCGWVDAWMYGWMYVWMVGVLVRPRPPAASILVCCFVLLGRVAGERQPSWTYRAGFLLLVEERVFRDLN